MPEWSPEEYVNNRSWKILIAIMVQKFLFLFLLLTAGLESGTAIASEAEAGGPPTDPVVTQAMQVWEKIRALRRMSENGIIPELEARGLTSGYSEETKMKVFRGIGTSEEFNNVQAAKLNDVIALLQCLRGHPIAKATIKPECAKDGGIDRLMAHAEKLMVREDQIMQAEAQKYR